MASIRKRRVAELFVYLVMLVHQGGLRSDWLLFVNDGSQQLLVFRRGGSEPW